MIKSMTGFGSAKGSTQGLDLTVEIKSVNNRFLDTNVHMPRNFLFAEDSVKAAVQRHISRGKVDVFFTVSSLNGDESVVKLNKPLLESYIGALKEISENYGLPFDLTAVSAARFTDVLTVEKADIDNDALLEGILGILEDALNDYDRMRAREGEKLAEDVDSRLNTISDFVSCVEEKAPETVEAYRNRLLQKMNEVLESKSVDETRIITEAAIFADHIAVDEETVRLRSHISQMRSMITNQSPVGRKLDFLIQEFNREANTIGSKCQNSDIAHVVVDLKSEIEKIREQIQNIE